jgi:hypothetical protein
VKEDANYEGSFKDGQIESLEIEVTIEIPEKNSQ